MEMSKEEQIELGKTLIARMRESFAGGDWDGTLDAYKQMAGIKADRPAKLEATCLAARTLVATKDRTTARKVLDSVSKGEYRKPAHYEFLARAHLDLKQYKEAAAACERAHELRLAPPK
jgi:predicted Zn-dependent protease